MSWYSYEDAREQKAQLQRDLAKRSKGGQKFEPLIAPTGNRKLVQTFWGKAWCTNLEAYSDYEYRLPRGRSYLRHGNVYNLEIEPGKVAAQVAGSHLYEVCVSIQPLSKTAWKDLKAECAGQVGSLLDLLAGKLGEGVLQAITHPQNGLFPKPKEISLSCSCPDWADMCKHVAAVLYGVGVKLDSAPELLFELRSVDPSELLSSTARETLAHAHDTDSALAGEDLNALFGIELAPEVPAEDKKPAKAAKAAKKPVKARTQKASD